MHYDPKHWSMLYWNCSIQFPPGAPSQCLWLFPHTLEKTGSFGTRFGQFLQSISAGVHILLMMEFNPVVSLIVWSLSVFVRPAIPLQLSGGKKKRFSCEFLSELFTSIYPPRAKPVLAYLEV